jgi:hypothetical protein
VAASRPTEPQAERRPLERTLHGLRLIDEYAWLKAENWREVMRDPFQLDPAIRAYLQAENDYCERALADTKSLQETLFAEMKGRIKEDDSSAPDPDGPYAYYVRYRKEGQHPLLCREPRNSMHFLSTQTADVKPEEQLLLDGDALAHGPPSALVLWLVRRQSSPATSRRKLPSGNGLCAAPTSDWNDTYDRLLVRPCPQGRTGCGTLATSEAIRVTLVLSPKQHWPPSTLAPTFRAQA